jgi:TolA-binding protein
LQFPEHTLTDEVLFKKASIRRSQGRYEAAALLYQEVVEKFGQDILADDALFQLADLVQNRMQDKERAMKLYEELLTKYPGSLYTVDARKRFRQLRGDKLN